jgi:RNA polymerase sigma-B factor
MRILAARPSSEYAVLTDMFRRLQEADETSPEYWRERERIFERCLPLAEHIARRYRNRGEPLDDLVQAARVGLVNAVNRFDADNGTDFLGFAVPTIMGEVRRHFRDVGWAVKVPRRLKELQVQLNRARDELTQQVGRAPTASELAEHLGIDREEVIESTIASSNYTTVPADMPIGSVDRHRTIGDTFGDVDGNLDKILNIQTVRPLIAALSERERTVLALRFFENMTQSEIADHIGCSQMHVSRILAAALGTLRSQAHDSDVEPRRPKLAVTA